jgi:hypothetical protein
MPGVSDSGTSALEVGRNYIWLTGSPPRTKNSVGHSRANHRQTHLERCADSISWGTPDSTIIAELRKHPS